MNVDNEQLLCYLAGGLDDRERSEVESALSQDPDVGRRLEIMRRGLEPLAVDREPEAPPAGLATATLARIAQHLCSERTPRFTRPYIPASRSWWRRADVIVAASLAALSLMLVFPLLLIWRESDGAGSVRLCQNRMRTYYDALRNYQQAKGAYPDVTTHVASPRDVAGLMVPMLVDGGYLKNALHHDKATPEFSLPTMQMIADMSPEQFGSRSSEFMPGYAYHLGHRDAGGVYHGPGQAMGKLLAAEIPLLADAPPFNVLSGNSPNHGGKGQNVLFSDGAVRFFKDRLHRGDDIYVNKRSRVAAGVDPDDFVLGGSTSRPLD
jgi:hypothetical protein